MRRAFADTLLRLATEDPRIIFLTADLGFQVFDEYQARFPSRYVNVGVAEAQLICAAAGLALEGWRPIAYSIASFATGRPFEQIRVSVCYPRLPVMIVGAGGGFTYASSGVTHHAPDDLGLMSLLPGMTVVAPGSPEEVTALMPQMIRRSGPSYLRIGKFGEPNFAALEPAVLGRARRVRDGERVALLTVGDVVIEALQAVEALNHDGLYPALLHVHTLKPPDTAALDRLSRYATTWIVIEEQWPSAGLYAFVCRWKAVSGARVRVMRLGPEDEFILGNPHRSELRRRIRCDREAIAEMCRKAWHGQDNDGGPPTP